MGMHLDTVEVSSGRRTAADIEPDSASAKMLAWVNGALSSGHPLLGRPNAVCPHAVPAAAHGDMWFEELTFGGVPTPAAMEVAVMTRIAVVKRLPRIGRAWRALVVSFPEIDTADDAERLIDGTQRQVRPCFVAAGLMIGEMHPWNTTPAKANPEGGFYPNRSPVSALTIRDMHPHDRSFLEREPDQALRRLLIADFDRIMAQAHE